MYKVRFLHHLPMAYCE
ncbi:hypothetical protein LB507_006015 [Fusarium sp. FIESC RH6]|nr:hypothetical protein LB507_006015 [Fusarium sp. FIESC RH6]